MLLDGIEMVGRPIHRGSKSARILDCEVVPIASCYSSQLQLFQDKLSNVPGMIFQPRYSPYALGASLFTTEYMTALLTSQSNLLSSSEGMNDRLNVIVFLAMPLDQGYLVLGLLQHSSEKRRKNSHLGYRNELILHQTVGSPVHIQVKFVIQDMIMHRPQQIIMNMEAVLGRFVGSPERGLNIPRRSNGDMDGSINIKLIVEQVIVITNGRHTAYNERNVLRDTNINRGSVTLNGVPGIELKKANAARVRVSSLIHVERSVQVSGICGAVKAADELESGLTEAERAIKVGVRGLERVGGGRVVGYGFLEAHLVDEPLSFVLDVV